MSLAGPARRSLRGPGDAVRCAVINATRADAPCGTVRGKNIPLRSQSTEPATSGTPVLSGTRVPYAQTIQEVRMDSPRFSRLCFRSALATLLILLPALGSAQNTGSIQGRVIDAATQAPIAGAQLSIVGTSRGVLTNTAGDFL